METDTKQGKETDMLENVATSAKFEMGTQVMTGGVYEEVGSDLAFAQFIARSLRRHSQGDWGDLSEGDKAVNEAGLRDGDRLLSSYNQEGFPHIWIITEWDRSVTTVLFPSER